MSITLVTQFDIKLLHAVESHINTKLDNHPIKEIEVTKIVTEVAVAKREAEIVSGYQQIVKSLKASIIFVVVASTETR